MPTAYIGIGSNLGNRADNCIRAIKTLKEKGLKILRRSSMIETEPWGVKEQPRFINMAIAIETDLSPEELLHLLKQVEVELGRTPGPRWSPRVIDLDILFYNDTTIKTQTLEIPHPGTYDRDFVLKPLSEIAPDKVHPVLKKSIKDILSKISL